MPGLGEFSMKLIAFLRTAVLAVTMLGSAPTLAQEKTGIKPGFVLAPMRASC